MHFVFDAQYEQDYVLRITFEDQTVKRVDLKNYLEGEIFEPLRQVDFFKQFTVHPELKTPVWKNGADFSPDFLYEIGQPVLIEQRG